MSLNASCVGNHSSGLNTSYMSQVFDIFRVFLSLLVPITIQTRDCCQILLLTFSESKQTDLFSFPLKLFVNLCKTGVLMFSEEIELINLFKGLINPFYFIHALFHHLSWFILN